MQIVRTVIVNDEQLKLIRKALMVASERDALDDEEQIEAGYLCGCIDHALQDDPNIVQGFTL